MNPDETFDDLADNPPLIDLPAFLRRLRQERYPTAVVYGLPLSGKSIYARMLSELPGFAYLDVLGSVGSQPDITANIDSFDTTALRNLIVAAVRPSVEVLVVDDLDFLLYMWIGDLDPFREMAGRLRHPRQAVAFVFFLQALPMLAHWELLTVSRVKRIIPFEQIKAL